MKRTYTKEDIVDGFKFKHKRYPTIYTFKLGMGSISSVRITWDNGRASTHYTFTEVLRNLNGGVWTALESETKPLYEIY